MFRTIQCNMAARRKPRLSRTHGYHRHYRRVCGHLPSFPRHCRLRRRSRRRTAHGHRLRLSRGFPSSGSSYCCHLRSWHAASSSFISCVAIVSSLLQCRAPTRSACALSTSTACVLCRQRLLGRVQRYRGRRPCFMPCGSAGGVFVSGTILLKSIVDARCDGERSNKRCTRAAAAACARAQRARECACVCVHFAGRFGTRRGG